MLHSKSAFQSHSTFLLSNGEGKCIPNFADEAAKFPFAEWRNEMLVRGHNALGILAWQQRNLSDAMRWLKVADEEQTRAGGNWVPDVTAKRKRLEGIIAAPAPRYCLIGKFNLETSKQVAKEEEEARKGSPISTPA